MTRDRRIVENQGLPEYATYADLPLASVSKGIAFVQDTATLGKIIMTLDELKSVLVSTKEQLTKASGEISAKIDALEAQLSTVVTTPEVDAALVDLKTVAQQLDDINPDVV